MGKIVQEHLLWEVFEMNMGYPDKFDGNFLRRVGRVSYDSNNALIKTGPHLLAWRIRCWRIHMRGELSTWIRQWCWHSRECMLESPPMKWTGADVSLEKTRARQLRHLQTGDRHRHQGEGKRPRIIQTTTGIIFERNGVQRRVGNNR